MPPLYSSLARVPRDLRHGLSRKVSKARHGERWVHPERPIRFRYEAQSGLRAGLVWPEPWSQEAWTFELELLGSASLRSEIRWADPMRAEEFKPWFSADHASTRLMVRTGVRRVMNHDVPQPSERRAVAVGESATTFSGDGGWEMFVVIMVFFILLGVALIDRTLRSASSEQMRHNAAVEALLAEIRDRNKSVV